MPEPSRSPFGHINIKVAGIPVTFDVDDKLAIYDVDTEMATVSADIAFWGDVWSSAQEEATNADAHYRAWRAAMTKQLLDGDPKLAEWKVKANIEAHPAFLKWKAAIAQAERNVILARTMVEAFDGKRATLQSKGAKLRAEMEATGVTTPAAPRPRRTARVLVEGEDLELDGEDGEPLPASLAPPTISESDTRVARMKDIFKGKHKSKS